MVRFIPVEFFRLIMAARSAAASRHRAGAANGTHAGAIFQVPGCMMTPLKAVVFLAASLYRAL
jgi:hypothetical protein